MKFVTAILIALIATPASAGGSVSLDGLPAELVAKVQEIVRECGSRVVSTYRPGAKTPKGHLSNHARRKAADLTGNPKCIYAHLKGWPGGYSTDYASAPEGPHVHISYNPGGMEWGLRFAHYHPSKKTRVAVVAHASANQKEH